MSLTIVQGMGVIGRTNALKQAIAVLSPEHLGHRFADLERVSEQVKTFAQQADAYFGAEHTTEGKRVVDSLLDDEMQEHIEGLRTRLSAAISTAETEVSRSGVQLERIPGAFERSFLIGPWKNYDQAKGELREVLQEAKFMLSKLSSGVATLRQMRQALKAIRTLEDLRALKQAGGRIAGRTQAEWNQVIGAALAGETLSDIVTQLEGLKPELEVEHQVTLGAYKTLVHFHRMEIQGKDPVGPGAQILKQGVALARDIGEVQEATDWSRGHEAVAETFFIRKVNEASAALAREDLAALHSILDAIGASAGVYREWPQG